MTLFKDVREFGDLTVLYQRTTSYVRIYKCQFFSRNRSRDYDDYL